MFFQFVFILVYIAADKPHAQLLSLICNVTFVANVFRKSEVVKELRKRRKITA